MKKILSIILALSLMLAFLPSEIKPKAATVKYIYSQTVSLPCSSGEVTAYWDNTNKTLTYKGSGTLSISKWNNVFRSGWANWYASDVFKSASTGGLGIDHQVKKIIIEDGSNIKITNGNANFLSYFETVTEIKGFSNIDFSSCDDFRYMFSYDKSLQTIDFTNVKLPSYIDKMNHMFYECNKLETIIGFELLPTQYCTDMNSLFDDCYALKNIDLTKLNTRNNENFSYMFSGCWKLVKLNLSHLSTSKGTDFSHMFDFCSELTDLDISNFTISNNASTTEMLLGSRNLQNLNLPACTINLEECAYTSNNGDLQYGTVTFTKPTKLTRAEDVFNYKFHINGNDTIYSTAEFRAVPGVLTEYLKYDFNQSRYDTDQYKVSGFYFDKEMTKTVTDKPAYFKDIDIYVKCTPATHTIHRIVNGEEVEPVTYEYGTKLTLLPYNKEGYEFNGWYTSSQLTNRFEYKSITEDTTVYATLTDNHSKIEMVPKKEPTCIEDGYESYPICSICKEPKTSIKVISKTGIHNYENGYCSVCGIKEVTETQPSTEEPVTSEDTTTTKHDVTTNATNNTSKTQVSNTTIEKTTTENIATSSNLAKTKITKLKKGKKNIQITVKKVIGADGYQFKIGTNKKITKGIKTKTSKKNVFTFTKLNAKKKYYIKARAYVISNGSKVYGKWSSVKSIKTK